MRNPRKRRRPLRVVIVLVVVAALAAFAYTHYHKNNSNANQAPTTKTAQLTVDQAKTLVTELSSRNQATQAKALAPLLRAGTWDPSTVLPSGVTLTIDAKSFHDYGNGLGSVIATATGKEQAQFMLILQNVSGQWLIYETERK